MDPTLEADDGAEHSAAEAEEDVERLELHVPHPFGFRRKNPSGQLPDATAVPAPFRRGPATIASPVNRGEGLTDRRASGDRLLPGSPLEQRRAGRGGLVAEADLLGELRRFAA